MADTPGRLLKLLSLLQTSREWPGPELARRLGVSARTVRNDVERLRALGYPVEASRGAIGGYRLAAGTAMPPLLLDDDEAVAVAVSLRSAAAAGTVGGIEETALRALTKLQQVLPARLGHRVDAVQAHTVRPRGRRTGTEIEPSTLGVIAAAASDRELLRFAYSDHSGAASERRVEPYRLVNLGRRWYLVAFDVQRADWRTFRVDRIGECRSVRHRFALRELPDEDMAGWVARKTRSVQLRFRARVLVDLPAEVMLTRMGTWREGTVEGLGPARCSAMLASRSAEELAQWLAYLNAPFQVIDSAQLAAAVRTLGARMLAAAGA